MTTMVLLAGVLMQSPVVSANANFRAPRQPNIAIDADGVTHLVFGDGRRMFHAKADGWAMQFDKPRLVADVPNLSLGMRRGPRVAVAGGRIVVTAIGGKQGKGRDGDLLAWSSSNGGRTWQGPVRVNDVADSAREGLHATAAGSNGPIACAWLDLRSGKTDIRVSTSKDGINWTPNVLAYRSPGGSVCECCHPTLAFDGKDLHLFWRNSLAGFRDMYRSVSIDGGKSFAEASKLGTASWRLNACPMDGGAIAVHGGRVSTAWRRERNVIATFGDDGTEVQLGDGEQPWIASTAKGCVVAWIRGRSGELLVHREGDARPTVLSSTANDPVVAAAPNGSNAVVAWEGMANGRPAVFVKTFREGSD